MVFTKDTIDNWKYLKEHPAQLAFALGMDLLIAHGALRAGVPGVAARESQITQRIAKKMGSIAKSEEGGRLFGGKATPEARSVAGAPPELAERIATERAGLRARARAERGAPKPWEMGETLRNMKPEERAAIVHETIAMKPAEAFKRTQELIKNPEAMKEAVARNQAAEQRLAGSIEKAHDAIQSGDARLLKQAGREMKDWARVNPDSPTSDLISRRASDFIKNADDYAKLKDTRFLKQAEPEGPPKAGIEGEWLSTQKSAMPKSQPSAIEQDIERSLLRAEEEKADAFYRDHKVPSMYEQARAGEKPAEHAQRLREYLEDRFGREYIEEHLDLTPLERDAVIKEVMERHLGAALDESEATVNDIERFLKSDERADTPRPENPPERTGGERPSEKGGGTRTAVKEKTATQTATKTEKKTRIEEEAERVAAEKEAREETKGKTNTEAEREARERTTPAMQPARAPGAQATDKDATPDRDPHCHRARDRDARPNRGADGH